MLLLIDAGNTRIKWALSRADCAALEPADWVQSGAVLHAEIDCLVDDWRGLAVRRVMMSNVAGREIGGGLAAACHAAGMPEPEHFASVAALAGVRNGYREPSQLGCDRFASLIGARALFPDQALIVATCGTATTIDALSADGLFIGGMILPGPSLMARTLAAHTAQLPQLMADMASAAMFADHTEAAIASGCIAAQAGAIDRAVQRHTAAAPSGHSVPSAQTGSSGLVACILSGGAAQLIAPHLASPHRLVDNLVLRGLATAYSTMPC